MHGAARPSLSGVRSLVYNSLHPALQNCCQYDPATQQEFLTYEALRAHLVTLGGSADQLIKNHERTHKQQPGNLKTTKQQQHPRHNGQAAAKSGLGATGGVKKPKGYHRWTSDQKALADAGKCVHCSKDWTPGHRCLTQKGTQVCAAIALPIDIKTDSPTTANPVEGSSLTCAPNNTPLNKDACMVVTEPATTRKYFCTTA